MEAFASIFVLLSLWKVQQRHSSYSRELLIWENVKYQDIFMHACLLTNSI